MLRPRYPLALVSTAILVAVLAGLLRRPTPAFDGRVAAMIVVATFAVVETEAYAHFKVNGSQNWTYPLPFGSLSYMDVPPSVMRPPGHGPLRPMPFILSMAFMR